MKRLYAAVMVLAVAFRAVEVFRRSPQVDEGLTLYLGSLRIADALTYLRAHDVHPPLLTLIVHMLAWMHSPDWLIRLVFVLIGAASVALVMATVRLWSDDRGAAIAGFFAACMPLLIFNDSMVRMYAPFDAVALLSFYLLSLLLVKPELPVLQRRALWTGWTLCAIAMLYLLYAAFFVLAAELAYAIIVRRDAAWRMLGACAVALVAWLPQYPTFRMQLPLGGVAFPFFAGHITTLIATLPEQATLQIPYRSAVGAIVVAAVWLWAAGALWLTICANRKSLLPWIAAPSLITLIYSLAEHKLLYADRYHTLFAYALCCWTGVALAGKGIRVAGPTTVGSAWWAQSRRLQMIATVAACVIIAAAGVQHVTDPRHTTADWNAIGRLLHDNSQPHDLFIFEQGSPVFLYSRTDVLAGHPFVTVFSRSQPQRALDIAAHYNRVWYIGFQAEPVDPTAIVLIGLQRRYLLLRYWRFEDSLESEYVLVAQFQGVHRAPH